MNSAHILKISQELKISAEQVKAAASLLEDKATIPFIARYRKEATGSLDEVQVTSIRDRLHQLFELDTRRKTIFESIDKQGKLTDELKGKISAAETLAELEDIYLPYKPKRRTRAIIAQEKGLEPLAWKIMEQGDFDLIPEVQKYLDPAKKLESIDEALSGARDIIAEWVNENAEARSEIRKLFWEKGKYRSTLIKGKEKEGSKFKDYFEWEEPVKSVPSHRMLAARRGEKEEVLMLRIAAPMDEALQILEKMFIKRKNAAAEQVAMAISDSYKRLISLSLETEVRLASKEIADKEAIRVFSGNLRQLLMAPPLGQKYVMAIDPGYRTGCKVVCLDAQGKLLENTTIYPMESEHKKKESAAMVISLCAKYPVEIIAIGHGTASRETEVFIKSLQISKDIKVVIASESGASFYSASEAAREEFPDYDVTVRGAVSIGRRLMDPLAELVKIDPKNIGVGQYQHDVDQALLKQSLDDVVISCVNQVGVELNSASKQLLMYVSGLGPARAQAIIEFRNEQGPFKTREQLRQISKLGPKAFEQAAGFLRIRDGENPLDASAVHPESYGIVDQMAADLNADVKTLMLNESLRKRIELKRYVSDRIGLPTLTDIVSELAKPGRDPRDVFQVFYFKEGIEKIEDLKLGMKLPGVVTNITAFGAFVDIGVHHDGLIHISQLSDQFVKDPNDVVKIHQKVMVKVMEIDLDRKRIALTLKGTAP